MGPYLSYEDVVKLAGERSQGLEVVRKTKSGDLLQLSLWTAPLVDPAGNIIGILQMPTA